MKIFKLFVRETLQRQVDIEAETIEDALKILESKYYDSEIVLDYSDLIDTEFCNCNFSKNEINIMYELTDFCDNHCLSSQCCPEEECVIY